MKFDLQQLVSTKKLRLDAIRADVQENNKNGKIGKELLYDF